MKIPHKILRRMLYYTESRFYESSSSPRVLYTAFKLVMPWYRLNVSFEIPWTYKGKEEGGNILWEESKEIIHVREQLDNWIVLQNLTSSARDETEKVLARIKNLRPLKQIGE
jgi:hypothetical protein